MGTCDFDKLVQLLDGKLKLDGKLEVLGHLDLCDVCREAIYLISRDRDRNLFTYYPLDEEWRVA